MASEATSNKKDTKGRETLFLVLAVSLPIVLVALIGGAPAIWKGFVKISATIIPNFWVIIAYAYTAWVGFLIGRRSKK